MSNFVYFCSGCGLMRAGAVAGWMEGETNLTVPDTFKAMTIRTLTIRVIEENKKG